LGKLSTKLSTESGKIGTHKVSIDTASAPGCINRIQHVFIQNHINWLILLVSVSRYQFVFW